MPYYDEIIEKVDRLIGENSVHHMNEMLMQLSHDPQLNKDQRFTQQQRLREARYR
ncbi:DUF2526 family protein [Providencia rettgeri]|nr:DUF2526 family protein [Providencia rettgeri]